MAIVDVSKLYQNVVFYVISPEGVAPLTTSSPLFTLLHLLQRSKPALSSIVSIPISTSQLYREETSCGRTSTERHNSLAFSLYDQLQVPVTKLRFPIPETFPSAAAAPNPANQSPNVRLFQSPAVMISPVRPRKISFDMNFPVSTLAIQQRHRFLHVGYTSKSTSADGLAHWVYVSTVDETGESWRSVNRFVKVPPGVPGDVLRVRLVWSLILQLLQGVDVEWRIVVCRLDEPTILEIRGKSCSPFSLSGQVLILIRLYSLGLYSQGTTRQPKASSSRHLRLCRSQSTSLDSSLERQSPTFLRSIRYDLRRRRAHCRLASILLSLETRFTRSVRQRTDDSLLHPFRTRQRSLLNHRLRPCIDLSHSRPPDSNLYAFFHRL